ncbi:PspC domain-containing protein [Cohnella suwonensis]|uniref:PspC domain-containing protein n=1 Tax=Cohnella suwonensis TaxID=696072 RepID=A0ABW0LW55_9BACL
MRKLYRSSRDRKLFGICGGLADYLNVDATLLRILLVVVAVFSAGSVVLVYIIAGFVIPKEPHYGGGYAANPGAFDPSWKGHDQPAYGYGGQGNNNWNPGTGAGYAGTPQGAPDGYGTAPQSAPRASSPPPTGRTAQGLDAMMEDIEKKSLQREIEELKARISKFEKESKGE